MHAQEKGSEAYKGYTGVAYICDMSARKPERAGCLTLRQTNLIRISGNLVERMGEYAFRAR